MSFYNTVNNASAIITSPHTIGDNVLSINPISMFGSGGFPLRATCFRQSDGAIVIYSISGSGATTLNISGVLEGTTDINLAVNDVCQATITAGAIKDIHNAIDAITSSGTSIVGTSGAIPIYTEVGLTENADFVFDNNSTLLKTPISDKGGQVYNVKSYGAIGDGVTDDTQAVKDTITAAPKGSIVFFPGGRYLTSSSIIVEKDLTLRGTCGTLSFIDTFGGNWDAPGYQSGSVILSTMGSGYAIDMSSASNYYYRVSLEDISIVGLGNSSRTTVGIRVARDPNTNFASFYGVRVANFNQGIQWNYVQNSHALDCFVMACYRGLVCNSNTNANVFSNMNYSGCNTSIELNGASVNIFQGGTVQGSIATGIYIGAGSEENTIKSIYFENNSNQHAVNCAGDNTSIEMCHFGGTGNRVYISSNSCKITPGKYNGELFINSSQGTLILGNWSGTIIDSGVNTTYFNSTGITTNRVQSNGTLTLTGNTLARIISNNNQSGLVVNDAGTVLSAASAGGLLMGWGGSNNVQGYSNSLYPTTNNLLVLGTPTERWRKVNAVDIEASNNFYGNGSGIINIKPSNIIPGTSGAIPIYGNTGLTEDTSFFYDKINQRLNTKGLIVSGSGATIYGTSSTSISFITDGVTDKVLNDGSFTFLADPTHLMYFRSNDITLCNHNISRLAFRAQDNGSTMSIGFYGAATVVKPSGDVATALNALGLVTNPAYVSPITSVISNTTLTVSNDMVLANASGAPIVITLPNATTIGNGREFTIKKIDSTSNIVAVSGVSSQTIDGSVVISISGQWNSYTIKSFSDAWYVKGRVL